MLRDTVGETKTATRALLRVLVIEGNPLMETAFPRNHLLSIELIEGGEVLAEPL